MSQQALANRAGIPRNQIVRAERGENITIDTLRKIAAQLPVTELTLLDTTSFRVDILSEPEKLFFASVENVLQQAESLERAIYVAMLASSAVEQAYRATVPLPGLEQPSLRFEPRLLLTNLERIATEIQVISKEAKSAS